MPKKCPPGVICIENVTIFVIIIIIIGLLYLVYKIKPTVITKEYTNEIQAPDNNDMYHRQNTLYSNSPNDVFMNPYAPPLKNNPFYNSTQSNDIRGGVPINIPTSHREFNYEQVGIAKRLHSEEMILPIFGRPIHSNRNKWQYYTLSGNNNIKLPINKDGKRCTNTYGCDQLYDGDSIFVEGYDDAFSVRIYDNDLPRYIPII